MKREVENATFKLWRIFCYGLHNGLYGSLSLFRCKGNFYVYVTDCQDVSFGALCTNVHGKRCKPEHSAHIIHESQRKGCLYVINSHASVLLLFVRSHFILAARKKKKTFFFLEGLFKVSDLPFGEVNVSGVAAVPEVVDQNLKWR